MGRARSSNGERQPWSYNGPESSGRKGRPSKTGGNERHFAVASVVNELATALDGESPDVGNDLLRYYCSDGRTLMGGFRYEASTDVEHFARNLQRKSLLEKFSSFSGSPLKKRVEAALAKWNKAEMVCFGVNCQWRQGGQYGHLLACGETSGTVIEYARRLISGVLGEVGPHTLESIFQLSDHGPGGTTRLPRSRAARCFKFSGNPEASPAISDWITLLQSLYPQWLVSGWKSRRTSKMVTVPKNAVIERVISSEPDLNIFFQKGVGALLKRMFSKRMFIHKEKILLSPYGLESHTIDLNSQSANQVYARYGSLTDEVSTVDMSMASDTIAYEVVKRLLPNDWFDLMCRLRTGSVQKIDGTVHHLEKFSSMGNGFTFELETLIFWGLCRALSDISNAVHPVLVYGDDIIVDSKITRNGDLELLLSICGFRLNSEKSFVEGPFRESCGSQYFRGVDVTPFYIREDVSTVSGLILLANNIARWNRRRAQCNKLTASYDYVVSLIPEKFRVHRIPDGYGDSSLIETDEVPAQPINCRELKPNALDLLFHGSRGWVLKDQLAWTTAGWSVCAYPTFIPQFRKTKHSHYGVLVAGLWDLKGGSQQSCSNSFFVGGKILQVKRVEEALSSAGEVPDQRPSGYVRGFLLVHER